MYMCGMTVTYVTGGSFVCSVMWLLVSLFLVTFITFLMPLCESFFSKL